MSTSISHTAFMAGYLPKQSADESLLFLNLCSLTNGVKKVHMPRKKWTGYCFVEFHTQKELEEFLNLGKVVILDKELII